MRKTGEWHRTLARYCTVLYAFGMNSAAKLTATQTKTADIVLALIAASDNDEVSEYAVTLAGAHLTALYAIVRKGVLTIRRGDFTMPAGPYAGETVQAAFFSKA